MTTTILNMQPARERDNWLTRRLAVGISPATLILAGIVILSACLHFYQLENIGDANLYYTAAVESMLQSWKNFFFIAAEPGGSVTIDKPPLGLWIEAASAFIFGVNGFAVVLPNILAGLASIPLIYHIVKKYFGPGAGLVAALVMAITPVAIAAQRNNTMDGMLTFTLILAAWAFLKATETNKVRFLWLGAVIVGLGFNIKMLQAFLPLPAFYAVYFLGARTAWWRKIVNLAVATVILLAVSLSWAIAVDLTPAEERPYIGSSNDNTVMELIIGHNGLSRWLGGGRNRDGGDVPSNPQFTSPDDGPFAPPQNQLGQPGGQFAPPNDGPAAPPAGQFAPPDGNRPVPPNNQFAPDGGQFAPPNDGRIPPPAGQFAPPDGHQPVPSNNQFGPDGSQFAPPDGGPNAPPPGARPGGSSEVGEEGIMRFFEAPLSKEMSWLLPFAALMALVILFRNKLTWPLRPQHQMLLLWGGWLAIGWVFFSFAGLFHAYYLVMLAPPLAVLVGAGAAELWRMRQPRPGWAIGLLAVTAVLTLIFQWYNASQFISVSDIWPLALGGIVLLVAGIAAGLVGREQRLARTAFALILAAMMIMPLTWSYLTTTDGNNVNLPGAYAGGDEFAAPDRNNNRQVNEALLAYLQANTQDAEYLMAVPSSMQGAAYVLETGRPVLYMGGFSGGDPVVDAADIAQMVADGDLRAIMVGGIGRGTQSEIGEWVRANCTAVSGFELGNMGMPGMDGRNNSGSLYLCDG